MTFRKSPIYPARIRKINASFSWIDHKFITGGYIKSLSKDEIILYYFLISVGDKNGLSYYHPDTICQLLKLDSASFTKAQDGLVFKDLVAYRNGLYQVLSLPEEHDSPQEIPSSIEISRSFKPVSISNT